MLLYKTLERLANRPTSYPRYSREVLGWVSTIRWIGYFTFALLGVGLLVAQERPWSEWVLYGGTLLIAGPLSTYLAMKARYPLESFSKWFSFDGLFLGYLVAVSGQWDVLILLFLAVQLGDSIVLRGMPKGLLSIGAYVISALAWPYGLIELLPLSDLGYWFCWGLVGHALIHLSGSFYFGHRFSESLVRRELQLKAKNKQIQLLNQEIREQVLSRYLPPALINDIFDGKISMDTKPHSKKVTVLFSDLSGFTKISEELGAEAVSEFLNDYLSAMNETIFANSGTIDKFIGDAIMVIFGAPTEMNAREQANNAARCALAMQTAMVGVNQRWAGRGISEVAMRIGIHQGQAVVGNFGSNQRVDYTAIGPSVNVASRIETACEPGQSYISGVVRELLADELRTEPVGNFKLKGIQAEIPLFKL
jgi:class 3 adenylate cyclase